MRLNLAMTERRSTMARLIPRRLLPTLASALAKGPALSLPDLCEELGAA
jgi:hypothetical protein